MWSKSPAFEVETFEEKSSGLGGFVMVVMNHFPRFLDSIVGNNKFQSFFGSINHNSMIDRDIV